VAWCVGLHRKSASTELRDVEFALLKHYGMSLPGLGQPTAVTSGSASDDGKKGVKRKSPGAGGS
jgi:hypothetical protein